MIDDLFESVDSDVFTPELKKEMMKMFNEHVENRAQELLEEHIENSKNNVENRATVLAEAMLDEKRDSLDAAAQAHIDQLDEAYADFCDSYKTQLENKVVEYIQEAVDEFVSEMHDEIKAVSDNKKAGAVIDLFEKTVKTLGLDISAVVNPEHQDSAINEELDRISSDYRQVSEEYAQMRENYKSAIVAGLISEASDDLSIPQLSLLEKLARAEPLNINNLQGFFNKFDELKESITGCEYNGHLNEEDDDDEDDEDDRLEKKKKKDDEVNESRRLDENFSNRNRRNIRKNVFDENISLSQFI